MSGLLHSSYAGKITSICFLKTETLQWATKLKAYFTEKQFNRDAYSCKSTVLTAAHFIVNNSHNTYLLLQVWIRTPRARTVTIIENISDIVLSCRQNITLIDMPAQ